MINVHNRIKYFLLVEIWNIRVLPDTNSYVHRHCSNLGDTIYRTTKKFYIKLVLSFVPV